VTWLFSLVFALLILSITSYAWFVVVLGRGVMVLSLASYSALSLFLKLMVYRSLFRSEMFVCRTVVIGVGDRARQMRRMVENELVLPAHKIVAFIRLPAHGDESATDAAEKEVSISDGVAVLDSDTETLEAVIRSLGVSLIIAALDDPDGMPRLYPHLKRLRFDGIEVLTPLSVAEIYRGITPLSLVNEEVIMEASLESGLPMVWRKKRLYDIAISIAACIVFFPFALLIALLLKLSAPFSPVFYTQLRVGQFGKVFRIYKFRTMREDAEKSTGPVWAARNDRRITLLGHLLRRFRVDEFPQFINILSGDMSLVGPRPERPEIVESLEEQIPFYRERENITPGLTGWAQVRYPYGESVEDAARKLEYDLYYMKHLSMSLDLQIILSTLRIVLLGKERVI
jgi:exopolysaccharide biosynthesis polyprenyl glycosylphosphotransferase